MLITNNDLTNKLIICLSLKFDEAACEICESFQKVGFWADFIDPSEKPVSWILWIVNVVELILSYLVNLFNFSIMPFNRQYFGVGLNDKNSYETEKRYRSLAVKLQVYAGCTLIAHKRDSKFVGCLVTTAPIHHPLVLSLIELFDS